MTQEEKELVLTDLCARLPYGVKFKTYNGFDTLEGIYYDGFINPNNEKSYNIEDIKPYLRSIDTMTDKERKRYKCLYNEQKLYGSYGEKLIDWFNAHHIDYRGLIRKGLALETPKEMYYEVGIK